MTIEERLEKIEEDLRKINERLDRLENPKYSQDEIDNMMGCSWN